MVRRVKSGNDIFSDQLKSQFLLPTPGPSLWGTLDLPSSWKTRCHDGVHPTLDIGSEDGRRPFVVWVTHFMIFPQPKQFSTTGRRNTTILLHPLILLRPLVTTREENPFNKEKVFTSPL